MDFKPKISIIIPVYNVEEYLKRCLDSVLGQSFKDIEIIAVNDGSTDSSREILKFYSEDHDNLVIIDQQNGGLSDARNHGLKVAQGKYVMFVDSDDFIVTDMVEKLYNKAEKDCCDMVICGLIRYYQDTGKEEIEVPLFQEDQFLTGSEAAEHYLADKGINGYAWNKIYKKTLFQDNNIEYPKGMLYEDSPTTFKLLWNSNRVSFLKEPMYYYVQRGDSITKVVKPKAITDFVKGVEDMGVYLKQKGIFEELKDVYMAAMISRNNIAATTLYTYLMDHEETEEFSYAEKKLIDVANSFTIREVLWSKCISTKEKLKCLYLRKGLFKALIRIKYR